MDQQSLHQTRTALPNTFQHAALESNDMPPASRRGARQLAHLNAVGTFIAGQDPVRSARDRERESWPSNQFYQTPSIVRQ